MTDTETDGVDTSMRPDGVEESETTEAPTVPEDIADSFDGTGRGRVLGVRLSSLGPPAEHGLTALPASAHNPVRLHQGLSTEQLRSDLVDLVELADCPELDLGFRVICAVEARHVMATLLARARGAGYTDSGSGLPDVTFDDGAALE